MDYGNLKYIVVSTGEESEFDKLENAPVFLNDIKTSKIPLDEARIYKKIIMNI